MKLLSTKKLELAMKLTPGGILIPFILSQAEGS